jgi:phospholipid/cholesterol/gamma-HCH transport system substrate-binding protein
VEPEAKYTLVGASVIVLLGLLAAAVVWLLASGQKEDIQNYTIYFTRQSLEGLEVRSDVRMKGIRVGTVTGFSFSETRAGTVQVEIGISPKAPVRESTRAVVDRNLVTGLASIRLLNVDETSPMTKRNAVGEPNPVIPEGASKLQQFSDTANDLAQRADETLRRISETLSTENQAAITESLDNLRAVTRKTDGALTRLDQTLVSVGGAADQLRSSARALTADTHRLTDRYDELGAETTAGIHELTGTVGQLSADVSRLLSRTETLLVDSDVELKSTSRQLRNAADSVGTAGRRFSDPRTAIFGPADANLGPGEERR